MRRSLATLGLGLLISVGVLYWLIAGTDLEALEVALERLAPWRIASGGLAVLVVQILRAWRFSILLGHGPGPPSLLLFKVTTQLLLFNFLLPFKLGEATFPLLMQRVFGTEMVRALGILLLVRVLDLAAVAGLFCLGAAFLPAGILAPSAQVVAGLLAALALVAPAVLVVLLAWLRPAVAEGGRARRLWHRLTEGAAAMRRPGPLVLTLTVSLLIWLVHAGIAVVVARAVQPDLSLAITVMGNAATHLAFALPVPSIAGLGPPQAAWVAVLTFAGIGWSPATSMALLVHGVLLTSVVILGGLAVLPWPRRGPPGERAHLEAP